MLSKDERYYYDAASIAEPSITDDVRRPYAPGQVDERGDGHDRGGGTTRASQRSEPATAPDRTHEYLFLLSKEERYLYDAEAIAEPATTGDHARNGKKGSEIHAPGQSKQNGISRRRTSAAEAIPAGTMRNRRSVWTISSEPYAGAHFAVMPTALVAPCILAGSRIGDVVLDPFGGSGTVGAVATELGRHATLIELNPEYVSLASERTAQESLFAQPTKSIATLGERDTLAALASRSGT